MDTGGASPGTVWYSPSTSSWEVLSSVCGAASQSRDTNKPIGCCLLRQALQKRKVPPPTARWFELTSLLVVPPKDLHASPLLLKIIL